MFGNKEGLLEALLVEGADRLYQRLDSVSDDLSERERLFELGRAYRRSALASPNMHQLIFSDLVPATERTRAAIGRTFTVLVDAVAACVSVGILRPQDPQQLATLLWTNVHGYVTLELTRLMQVADRDALFEQSLDAVFRGLSAR
ncbi:MAG: TetR-like C-terminal domain-containing protein [Trueperaceae bacterium]|nr:TetR-like C-terminal domain-containing protein [Trueperaceae bacterium]